MPIITGSFDEHHQPIINVLTGVHGGEESDIFPIPLLAMIDTGATMTGISAKVAGILKLKSLGKQSMTSVHGVTEEETYSISISFFDSDHQPHKPHHNIKAAGHRSDLNGVEVIIGCDVLGRCVYIHDGIRQTFTLSFGWLFFPEQAERFRSKRAFRGKAKPRLTRSASQYLLVAANGFCTISLDQSFSFCVSVKR